MIQSPMDEVYESFPHSLPTRNKELNKREGFQNYLVGSRDGNYLIPGNAFHCLLLVLVVTSYSSLSSGFKNGELSDLVLDWRGLAQVVLKL